MLYLTINTKINILVYMSEDKIKLLIVLFLHILIFLFLLYRNDLYNIYEILFSDLAK